MGPMGGVGPWMGVMDHPVRPPMKPPQPPPPSLPPKSIPEGDFVQKAVVESGEIIEAHTSKGATSESGVTEVTVGSKGSARSAPPEPPEGEKMNSKNPAPDAAHTLPVVIPRRRRTPLIPLTGPYYPLLPGVLTVELYGEAALGRDGGGGTAMKSQLEGLKCSNSDADMVVEAEVSSSPTTTSIPIEEKENQGATETAVLEENDTHKLKEDFDDGTAACKESDDNDEDDLYGDLFINDGERNEGGESNVKERSCGGDNGQGGRDDELQSSNAAALGGPTFEVEPDTIRAAMTTLCALERTVMVPSLLPETDELENALGLLSVPLAVNEV